MDKQLIAERFARSRHSYDKEAKVQAEVARKMIGLIEKCCPQSFRRIVEIGCGTGIYSQMLLARLRPDALLLNDLCPEMGKSVAGWLSPAVGFVAGDAEKLEFPAGNDLITSCSTLQWFADVGGFFRRCHSLLQDRGVLAFATFGRQNLKEIRSLTGNGLDYIPLPRLKASLETAQFDILHAEEEESTLLFPTPLHVLRHLKGTGVTGTEKRVWTRHRLECFCNSYHEMFATQTGDIPLTYHPIYIIAQKKNTR